VVDPPAGGYAYLMRRHWVPILILLLISIASAQPPATTQSSAEEIPPDVLRTMYQRELGELHQRASFEQLHEAHRLIEQYFRATTAADRRELTTQIESTGIDANILGRITRIRLHWQPLQPGAYYFNERVGPHQVRYFLGIPQGYDRSRPWPLVIMLPGAEAFLGDPRPTGDQVAEIYAGWIREELARHPDAIVLMPLLNLNELYGPSQTGMNTVMQPMHHAANQVNIDPAQVYLFGHSLGGHAAWNLALHHPTYLPGFPATPHHQPPQYPPRRLARFGKRGHQGHPRPFHRQRLTHTETRRRLRGNQGHWPSPVG
jgi:hypothetical protein